MDTQIKTYCTIHAIAINKDGKYLVTKRAKGLGIGIWRPVSGYIRERESAEDAAVRELKEETNLDGKVVHTSKPFWADKDDRRFIVVALILAVNDVEEIKLDKSEASDYKWIDKNDLLIEKSYVLKRTMHKLGII